MDPLELARRTYLELSPISYLQHTHDAKVYDAAFDGMTLTLISEAWVGTDPADPEPGQRYRVIFSRYRATFFRVENLRLESLEPESHRPSQLQDFIQNEIRTVYITLPNIVISTDEHELRFTCRSFDVDRMLPEVDG